MSPKNRRNEAASCEGESEEGKQDVILRDKRESRADQSFLGCLEQSEMSERKYDRRSAVISLATFLACSLKLALKRSDLGVSIFTEEGFKLRAFLFLSKNFFSDKGFRSPQGTSNCFQRCIFVQKRSECVTKLFRVSLKS